MPGAPRPAVPNPAVPRAEAPSAEAVRSSHGSASTPHGSASTPNGSPAGSPGRPAGARRPDRTGRADVVKIYLFVALLLILFVVGLLFFLRPAVSETEKRELTRFPSFTWESFWSGEYFAQISTWYSDTFPGREVFISLNQALKNIYGIRTMQIVQNPSSDGTTDPGGNDPLNPGNEDDDTPVERFDKVFIDEDRAFEIYKFIQTASDRYASIINSVPTR